MNTKTQTLLNQINETLEYNDHMCALMRKLGTAPIDRAMALDMERIPRDDPRRVFEVDAETFNEARKLGFDKVYGLRLVQIGT